MYACIYTYMYVYICKYIHVYVYIYMYICIYMYVYIYIYICAFMYIYTWRCIFKCRSLCLYVFIFLRAEVPHVVSLSEYFLYEYIYIYV